MEEEEFKLIEWIDELIRLEVVLCDDLEQVRYNGYNLKNIMRSHKDYVIKVLNELKVRYLEQKGEKR